MIPADSLICSPTRRQLKSVAMTPAQPRTGSGRTREILVVIAFTLIGALLRLWSVSRLGLSHFDEGIYAASGFWIFARHGILDLDPSLIAYAPPGFPFLVGVSYFALGVSDLSPILVSIALGTLTIPAVAWLAHRSFGSGAGGVAAAFLALSGAHVAFSRMALTDVSFLLVWVLALIQSQRFLEQPGAFRAVLLGLAVGAAQLFKYNGWLAGAAVVLSAIVWLALHPGQWRSSLAVATWIWGLLAAAVAALVYWPWFAFVQSHGGYGALLAHQRGYLGGFSSWPGHLALQLAQARALSGGPMWVAAAGFAAAVGILLIHLGDAQPRVKSEIIFLITLVVASLRVTPDLAWWVPLFWLPLLLLYAPKTVPSRPVILVYAGWLTLLILTPFYHPYARLWLPLHAFECVFLGGLVGRAHSEIEAATRLLRDDKLSWPVRPGWFFYGFTLVISTAFSFHFLFSYRAPNKDLPGFARQNPALPGLLAPTDSLKLASASIAHDLPATVKNLRLLARPPLTFYLGRSAAVTIEPQAGLSGLLRPADPSTWALFDTAIIRQDDDVTAERDRSSADWVLVRTIPTPLSLPVLLDIDPAVASRWNAGASVELRIMRPKRAGDIP
jgi:dolichyl-phosphate-mannose-protein mannosyltransferase